MTPNELQTAVEALETLSKTGNDLAEVETQARLILAEKGIENEPEFHCKVLLALSTSLYRRGLVQEALSYAQQALSLAQDNQFKDLEARALSIIGNVYFHLLDYSKALEYHGKALALYEELGDKDGIARILGNIGIVYQNLSDYSKALEYHGKALALYEELGDKDGIARILGNIGIMYDLLSDYAKALEYYGKSLALHEELGRKNGISINLGNCGNVYFNLSDYSKALEYYGKALALNEELGNKNGIALNLGNCGNVYFNLSDYSKALEYYGKALALNEELGSKDGIASDLGNCGAVYFSLSDYPKALEYYGKALALNEELGRKNGISINLGNCGIVYSKEGFDGYDAAKAEEYLLKSLAINEEIGAKSALYEIHQGLAELYEKQERWKKHSFHYKKYHEIYLEVQSEEATKQAQLMEYRRKVEEAERDRQVNLARFQEREKILDNILPSQITERLIKGEQPIADKAENVSVFFSDIVGFTTLSQKVSAKELVTGLNELFVHYDTLAKRYGLEKIKTIGDAYMAVCGVPLSMEDHAIRTAQFAIGVQELFAAGVEIAGHRVSVRIGLHCGEVVAGVIGEQKFAYDLWGDAVNTAARMESHGEAGKIHCSEEFKNALTETHGRASQLNNIQFISRGEMEIKGKGMMRTYFLEKAQ